MGLITEREGGIKLEYGGWEIHFSVWFVKAVIFSSMLFQFLLFLFALLRKRTANGVIHLMLYGIVWCSSKVPVIALGLLWGAQGVDKHKVAVRLWAVVMFLHLGGRKHLSAYSLVDIDHCYSPLWLLVLFIGFLKFLYHLQLPFLFMVGLAFLRIIVRAWRLRQARNKSPLPNSYSDDPVVGLDETSQTDLPILLKAHSYLRNSLQLVDEISDGIVPQDFMENVSRYFHQLHHSRAMRIVELELHFIYECFYTDGAIRKYLSGKFSIIYSALCLSAFFICFAAFVCFVMSFESSGSDNLSKNDYNVTAILLFMTLILEFASCITSFYSDWTIVALREYGTIRNKIFKGAPKRKFNLVPALTKYVYRSWSGTIPQFNFISLGIQESGETDMENFSQKGVWGGVMILVRKCYARRGTRSTEPAAREMVVSNKRYTDVLGQYLFTALKNIQQTANRTSTQNVWRTIDVSFKRDVLMWHLVTDCLYAAEENAGQANDFGHYKEFSKLMSDYMAYLILVIPTFLKGVGIIPSDRIRNLQSDIHNIAMQPQQQQEEQPNANVHYRRCCQEIRGRIYEADETSPWFTINQGISVLGPVSWEAICETWVDVLLHAASQCDPKAHVKGLSEGGELISFVWICAFHAGLLQEGPIQIVTA